MTAPAPRPTRITLVEDDASLLAALTFALEAEGYAVTPFAAGRPLLDAPPDADCLVVDLKLPDMNGLTLISRLRTIGIQPPAILITSNPDQRVKSAAAAARVVIVEKPLIGVELRRRIEDVLRDGSPRDARNGSD